MGGTLIQLLRTAIIYVCGTAIGRGLLLWLASEGHHPEAWVATMIGEAIDREWLLWLIAGLFGLVITIAIEWYLRSPKDAHPVAVPAEPSKRIPLAEFRKLAAKAGWNMNLTAIAIGDNEFWTFHARFRQATVDGKIALYGKVDRQDILPAKFDTAPLISIDPSHFQEFELSGKELACADDYNIRTRKDGDVIPGQSFRGLHIDEHQAVTWLAKEGRPPEPASFSVHGRTGSTEIEGYKSAYALRVTNVGDKDLDECCLVQVDQAVGINTGTRLPLVLRTDGQIKGERSSRFNLSRTQPKMVPVVFEKEGDATHWMLFDEQGKGHRQDAERSQLLIGIYGGATNGKVLLTIERHQPTGRLKFRHESTRADSTIEDS